MWSVSSTTALSAENRKLQQSPPRCHAHPDSLSLLDVQRTAAQASRTRTRTESLRVSPVSPGRGLHVLARPNRTAFPPRPQRHAHAPTARPPSALSLSHPSPPTPRASPPTPCGNRASMAARAVAALLRYGCTTAGTSPLHRPPLLLFTSLGQVQHRSSTRPARALRGNRPAGRAPPARAVRRSPAAAMTPP
jgi:hypothetical protein